MHIHEYGWIEEPGDQSRTLEWVRDCASCHYSPDRRPPLWRVLITGSRAHSNRSMIWSALDAEMREHGQIVVIEGQCPHGGADKFAEEWAIAQSVVLESYPANWKALGKIAGPYRNQQMVDAGADVCLAFPLLNSRGTYDCMRRAEEAGIPVKVFE